MRKSKLENIVTESEAVIKWNSNNTMDTPVCYYEPYGRILRTYPSSKAWTEDGYDMIMLEDLDEPAMLSKVSKDPTRLPRSLIEKYSKKLGGRGNYYGKEKIRQN